MSGKLEETNRAFQKVGEEYGYTSCTVEFIAFKDFKVQWSRSSKFVHFRLSDYLEDAPEEVFEGLARTLFSKIVGKDDVPYSKAMREWVLNPEFSVSKRPIYKDRALYIKDTQSGNEKNLNDSVERLIEMGLVDKDADFEVIWTSNDRTERAASCSVLMRLITVSDRLDDSRVPDYALDFTIYSQYLRIIKGSEVFGITAEVYTREDERKFKQYREAERVLDKMSLYL